MYLRGQPPCDWQTRRSRWKAMDYVSVPPDTAHSFAFTSHRTRLLTGTFGDKGAAMYGTLGQPTEAVTYSTHTEPPD